jgi:hypothetical protein
MEKQELIKFIETLTNRIGEKPKTIGSAPHTQTDQFPENISFADDLDTYVMTFENVKNGISHIGDGGLRAYFIETDNNEGFNEKFLVDNEFAHIHRHGSHSLHITLPTEIGLITDTKGWTEKHPLAVAGRIPKTNHMLFGARNNEELEISKKLLRISYLFATKQW